MFTEEEHLMELTELLDVNPMRVDVVSNPSVPKARRWLLFKSKDQKEDHMASTFVEDLTAIAEKIKKTLGDSELKKEGQTLLADIQTAVEDENVEFTEKDITGALKQLDTALKAETVTKESIAAYHAQVKNLLAKASVKAETEEEDPTKTALKKADLTDEQRTEIESILKADAERIEKANKEREERIEKAETAAKSAREEIRKMQIEAEHRDWIEKASKKWSHLVLGAKELGQLFMDLREIEQATKDKLVALLDSCEEQVKKSRFFEEIGSSLSAEDSPEGEVDALAREMVTKSDGKLSMIEAQAEVWRERPDLMKEYATNKAGV